MEMGGWKFACFQVRTALPHLPLTHIYMSHSNQHTTVDTTHAVIERGITFVIFLIMAENLFGLYISTLGSTSAKADKQKHTGKHQW